VWNLAHESRAELLVRSSFPLELQVAVKMVVGFLKRCRPAEVKEV